MRISVFFVLLSLVIMPVSAHAQAPFTLTVPAFQNGAPIPPAYAFCQPDGNGKTKDGGNINPALQWSGAPEGTKSFALIVVDPDVPASFDHANQPGKILAKDAPRQNFYHWVLYDIPADVTGIAEGEASRGIITGGKPIGRTGHGITGPNDYARAFGKGSYGGYDGPCPPWNDARLHHYHFVLYALSVSSLELSRPSTGKIVEDALAPHVLAKTEWVGTYSNNPAVNAGQ